MMKQQQRPSSSSSRVLTWMLILWMALASSTTSTATAAVAAAQPRQEQLRAPTTASSSSSTSTHGNLRSSSSSAASSSTRRRLNQSPPPRTTDPADTTLPPPLIPIVEIKTTSSQRTAITDPKDDAVLQDLEREGVDDDSPSHHSDLIRITIRCQLEPSGPTPPDTMPEECYEALEYANDHLALVTKLHILHEFSVGDVHTFAAMVHVQDINKIASAQGLSILDDPVRELADVPGSLRYVSLEDNGNGGGGVDAHRNFISNRRLGVQSYVTGAEQVQIPDVVQKYYATGRGVSVCIIDSGMHPHADMKGASMKGSSNPQVVSPWNEDYIQHGTFIGGIMAANSDVFRGIAPDANFFVVRVFQNSRRLFGSDLVAAAQLCRSEARADIIQISLGGPKYNIEEDAYFEKLKREGTLVVASSGNTGRPNDGNVANYPGNYSSVLSVGAVDEVGDLAVFSTRNDQVNLVAPGVRILSTISRFNETTKETYDSYATWNGTSMSAPFVSGALALLLSNAPYASRQFLTDALQDTAYRADNLTRDDGYGHGLLQVADAMDYVLQADCITAGGQYLTLITEPEDRNATRDATAIKWEVVDARNGLPITSSNMAVGSAPPTCISTKRCYNLVFPDLTSVDEISKTSLLMVGEEVLLFDELEVQQDVTAEDRLILEFGFCPVINKTVDLLVLTDDYGSDISYWLEEWDPKTRRTIGKPIFEVQNTLGDQATAIEQADVDSSKCWRLRIDDSWGDGILDEGRGIRASYNSIVYYEGREFGSGGSIFFGDACA